MSGCRLKKTLSNAMAKRKQKLKKTGVARREWAEFTASNHGQGAHQDKSRYTRKRKHKRSEHEQ